MLRPVAGKVKAIEGVRPGVLVVSQSYGHWGYGGADVQVDGAVVKGDPRRTTGLSINPVLRLDDHLKTGCLTDPIGGSAVYYDARVNVVKV